MTRRQIEGQRINDLAFFTPLLDMYPHLSFGSHPHSVKGEAFRFGVAEQSVQLAVYGAMDSDTPFIQTAFMEALAKHSIGSLDTTLHNSSLSKEALTIFDIKSAAAMEWLALPECERRLREEYGVTLSGAPPELIEEFQAHRHDKQALWQFAVSKVPELQETLEEKPLSAQVYKMCGAFVGGMSPTELKDWLTHSSTIVGKLDISRLNVFYAINRTMIKADRTETGIQSLLTESLMSIPAEEAGDYREALIQEMRPFLHKDSIKLGQALALLERPTVQRFLQIVEHNEPFGSLGDLIRHYPETRILDQQIGRTPAQEEIIESLIAKHTLSPEPDNDPDKFVSFAEAQVAARVKRLCEQRLQREFGTVVD